MNEFMNDSPDYELLPPWVHEPHPWEAPPVKKESNLVSRFLFVLTILLGILGCCAIRGCPF